MKQRNLRLVILAILLALTVGFSLVSCGGDDTTCTEHVDADANGKCDSCDAPVENGGGGGDVTVPEGDIELVKNGSAAFRIVTTNDTSTALGKTLTNFVKTLNECIEAGNVEAILEQTAATGTEIIIGPVQTRGDKFTESVADPYAYGYNGWSVKMVDGNVLVLAGSTTAYKDAIEYLQEEIFGINDDTLSIDSATMKVEQEKTEKQTKFDTTVKIDGNSLSEYVFAINAGDSYAIKAINNVRTQIFKKTGVYLKTVTSNKLADGQKAIWIESVELNGAKTTPDGAKIYVEDGNLRIETEFPDKLEELATEFLMSEIGETKKASVSFSSGLVKTKNVRDIYYKDFGAIGDGDPEHDDFYAIKACHDYANKWGHNVHADGPDAVYYIGNYLGTSKNETSIIIKTDTNWHGCTFIFDDTVVPANSGCYNSPIFRVKPDNGSTSYTGEKVPVASLYIGATDLGGWAPGVDCLIVIEDSSHRHFIRYGNNADNGQIQQEMIYVHADGTIDESTPLHWDYESISALTVYPCNDAQITLTGGDGDQRATVKTMFNNAPSKYTYFWRNILIERSNTIVQNINHVVEGEIPEADGGTGAPYKGFLRANYCNNVLIKDVMIHKLRGYHLETDKSNSMGSYEMGSSYSNNVTWRNITQNVFYDADGGVSGQGLMGTGYCKNMTLEDCLLHSFDAHQGIYNVTLRNSIFEHINFIGDGTLTLEDVTIYVDPKKRAITLRGDYGSHWQGDVIMKNVDLKYENKVSGNKDIHLIYSEWHNHYFGYTCYLPNDIYMENVNLLGFDVTVDSKGVRNEVITNYNTKELYLFTPDLYKHTNVDISDPNASIPANPNDWTKCTCATRPDSDFKSTVRKYFYDKDGDGQCDNSVKSPNGGSIWCNGWENEPDTSKNLNPYIGTKTVTVVNGDTTKPLKVIWPLTKQFKDLDVTVDGVLIIKNGYEI